MRKAFAFYALLSFIVIIIKLVGLDSLENYLKPLLMPSLAYLFYKYSSSLESFDFKILLALLFSMIGDVLLMPLFNAFIPGLVGFFIAHIFYISAFFSEKKNALSTIDNWKKSILIFTGLLFVGLLFFLIPTLESVVLKTAIFLYSSMLYLLLFSAVIRKPPNILSSNYIIWGAFLFLLSDSMIAINKFLVIIPLASFFIMSTYTIAQAFIVYGCMIRKTE